MNPKYVLVTEKRIVPVTETDAQTVKPQEATPYFDKDQGLSGDDVSIGYLTLKLKETTDGPFRFEIPAGEVIVTLKQFLGQANPAALASLGKSYKRGERGLARSKPFTGLKVDSPRPRSHRLGVRRELL